jgi:hypothetical protein
MPDRQPIVVRVFLCACIGLAPGCSWIGVRSVRPGERCTPWTGGPIMDTAGAVLGLSAVALGLVAVASSLRTSRDCPECESIARGVGLLSMLTGGAVAMTYSMSAAYGYAESRKCRERLGSADAIEIQADVTKIARIEGETATAVLDRGADNGVNERCEIEFLGRDRPPLRSAVLAVRSNSAEVEIPVPAQSAQLRVILLCPPPVAGKRR